MSSRELSRLERDTLEQILDMTSLAVVVDALAAICDEKADHIAENWQDLNLAKAWHRAARAVACDHRKTDRDDLQAVSQ